MSHKHCFYVALAEPDLTPPTVQRVGDIEMSMVSSVGNSDWEKLPHGSNMPVKEELYSSLVETIRLRGFKTTMDIVLNEVYYSSKFLAELFGKDISDRVEIPSLIEGLRQERTISEEEYDRLATLIMALDGLDEEVREYGGTVSLEDVDYMSEYLEILKHIALRHCAKIGSAYLASEHFHSDIFEKGESRADQRPRFTKVDTFIFSPCQLAATNEFSGKQASECLEITDKLY